MSTKLLPVVLASCLAVGLTACGGGSASKSGESAKDSNEVTVTNCGKKVTYPKKAERLYVNDGSIIAMALSAGAQKQIAAISSAYRDKEILTAKYGADTINSLHEGVKGYMTLESVIANRPDVVVAGWDYGFSEANNLTPDNLHDKGINSYLLTESCRQKDGQSARGVMDPWNAVRTDITNLATLTGNEQTGKKAVQDMDDRLDALQKAPKARKTPTVLLFDSAKDTVFTSGSKGGPQAIINAAGAQNGAHDVNDTWVRIGWEKVATMNPDAIAFVDYDAQPYSEKIKILESNPATKNLDAVKKKRYLNLPIAMWTSGPLNIDAAEHLRVSLEKWGLEPKSSIKPQLRIPASVPGHEG